MTKSTSRNRLLIGLAWVGSVMLAAWAAYSLQYHTIEMMNVYGVEKHTPLVWYEYKDATYVEHAYIADNGRLYIFKRVMAGDVDKETGFPTPRTAWPPLYVEEYAPNNGRMALVRVVRVNDVAPNGYSIPISKPKK